MSSIKKSTIGDIVRTNYDTHSQYEFKRELGEDVYFSIIVIPNKMGSEVFVSIKHKYGALRINKFKMRVDPMSIFNNANIVNDWDTTSNKFYCAIGNIILSAAYNNKSNSIWMMTGAVVRKTKTNQDKDIYDIELTRGEFRLLLDSVMEKPKDGIKINEDESDPDKFISMKELIKLNKKARKQESLNQDKEDSFNIYPTEKSLERYAFNENAFIDRYKCKCGQTRGRANHDLFKSRGWCCPVCGTPVEYVEPEDIPLDNDITINGGLKDIFIKGPAKVEKIKSEIISIGSKPDDFTETMKEVKDKLGKREPTNMERAYNLDKPLTVDDLFFCGCGKISGLDEYFNSKVYGRTCPDCNKPVYLHGSTGKQMVFNEIRSIEKEMFELNRKKFMLELAMEDPTNEHNFLKK